MHSISPRRLRGTVRIAVAGLLVLATAACTNDAAPEPPDAGTGTPAPRYTWTPSPIPARPDTPAPLHQPVELTGGGSDLVVTLDTTAFDPVFDGPDRTFWMFLTLENVGDRSWRGTAGGDTVLIDELDARFRPERAPSRQERSSDATSFGYDDVDLTRPVTVDPGRSVQGVLVFRVSGGPREVVLDLDLGDGLTAALSTNFGLL